MVSSDGGVGEATRGHRAAPATSRARVGAEGEALAERTLVAHGYRVIARNWHCRYGELDLIAEDGGELVFVEVKTRRGRVMGTPEEALTPSKRKRLLAAAQQYLMEHDSAERSYRFDVVAIEMGGRMGAADVRVHPNAFAEE